MKNEMMFEVEVDDHEGNSATYNIIVDLKTEKFKKEMIRCDDYKRPPRLYLQIASVSMTEDFVRKYLEEKGHLGICITSGPE